MIYERDLIKKYNNERGFGFISTSNFGDVFFHIKDFQKGEQPIVGREVRGGPTCLNN